MNKLVQILVIVASTTIILSGCYTRQCELAEAKHCNAHYCCKDKECPGVEYPGL